MLQLFQYGLDTSATISPAHLCLQEETNSLDAPTLIMGQFEEPEEPAEATGSEKEEEVAIAGDDLRATQWQVIHQLQKTIRQKHPDMTPKEILKQAREQLLGCKRVLSSSH